MYRALALIGAALACSSPPTPTDADQATADCVEARDHSDLAWIQENIFTASCATTSLCHRGQANDARGLNLEDGMALDNLIDEPSYQCFGETLVVPGAPRDSYLMATFGVYPAGSCMIQLMPFRQPPLCKDKHDAIERWITSLEQ